MNIFSKDPSIPWYHTRLFWGLVIGVLLAWGAFAYIASFYGTEELSFRTFTYFSFSFGGALFYLLGSSLFGKAGTVLATLFYFSLTSFLLYKTFYEERVPVCYPITFLVIFIIGMLTAYSFASGL